MRREIPPYIKLLDELGRQMQEAKRTGDCKSFLEAAGARADVDNSFRLSSEEKQGVIQSIKLIEERGGDPTDLILMARRIGIELG